jgi:coenzyme PQQ precursor peptide PqqA
LTRGAETRFGGGTRSEGYLADDTPKEEAMAWNTPEIEETECGMEINMYLPAEEEGEELF